MAAVEQIPRLRCCSINRPALLAMAVLLWLGDCQLAVADVAALTRRSTIRDWNQDPVIWLVWILVGWLYFRGVRARWHSRRRRPLVTASQVRVFWVGWLMMAVALLSPLDAISEQLAWAHMVQHLLLMTVVAPLCVVGAGWLVMLWGLPLVQRRALGRAWSWLDRRGFPWQWGWQPLFVWTLYAVVMWIWHVPDFYAAALRSPLMHDLQHLTFFLAACLFWRLLVDPISQFRIGGGGAVLVLFTTALHSTVLGVLMMLSPHVWYADYIGRAELWGISALEDQQLAGLIMSMPGCAPYLLAALMLLARAIQPAAQQQHADVWPLQPLGKT